MSDIRTEKVIRKEFEKCASEGTKNLWYDLTQTASDEYVSPFTEYAWRMYRDGYLAGQKRVSNV